MTIYQADWLCPVSSSPVRQGCMAVENGRIVSLPDRCPPDVVFAGCAIIPGFVNAHSHLELTILRGFLDDLPFATWIPRLTRAKYEVLSSAEMLLSSRLGCIEMLRAGVTCLGEVMDIGTAWEAMHEFGLQGIAFQEVFGPAEEQADHALRGLKERLAKYRRNETETLRVGVSPHAPYTVSAKLYRSVDEFSRVEDLRLATHIAESRDEGTFVRFGSGVFADRWRERGISTPPRGCSPLAYIAEFGLLRPGSLLIHAIDLEESDFRLLEATGSTVVHCPKSNAKLAHGSARVEEMLDGGVMVGLGTDSVASNNVVDMFEEMRAAIFQQRVRNGAVGSLDAKRAFRMATLGGAECLGMAEHLGTLDPGKRADFVVVDLNDPAVQPVYDPIEAMVYSASRHNVRATFIGGREVKIDPSQFLRDCVAVSERLKAAV